MLRDSMRRCKKGRIVKQTAERITQKGRKSACLGGTFVKDGHPKHLYKSTTDNVSFFNREQIFLVRKVVKTSKDNCLC